MEPLDADVDPRVLGPFWLLAVIGQGGMGRAYLARRLPLESMSPEMEAAYFLADEDPLREDGLVAVKVISPDFLHGESDPKEAEKRARFAGEISALRAVVSDRVPSLLGADPDAAKPWLAVDYIHGPNLSTMVKKAGTLSVVQCVALGLALVGALRAIHEAKLLHRDLKPLNVVLGPDGPVVLDFGLAVLAERRTSQALTQTGVGFGSIGYLPVEQALDLKRVKQPADVFSLGATLFFALTGRPPYPVSPMMIPPSWHGVDGALIPLLEQVLLPDPEQRPSLNTVELSLRGTLGEQGLTREDAEAQLYAAVKTAGLVPELPPEALADHADPTVREAAQRAVDTGAAPDSPWAEGADLFEEFFSDRAKDTTTVHETPGPPGGKGEFASEGPAPSLPLTLDHPPTLVDPAAQPPTSYPLAPPHAPPAVPAPAPTAEVPRAAIKAAERLRKAYAHSGRL